MPIPITIEKTLAGFAKKYITAHYAPDRESAFNIVKAHLNPGVTVAMGNSLTLREIGVFSYLQQSNNNLHFINQFEPGISAEENLKRRKQGLMSDLFLSSANAITEDGKICCVDGKGNRVAALMFGPDKVLVVAGRNKIVKNEDEAWHRIKNWASPQTALHLKRNLPCTIDGKCHDCSSAMRICKDYVTINGQLERDKDRISLILVNEDLGI